MVNIYFYIKYYLIPGLQQALHVGKEVEIKEEKIIV